MPSLSEQKVCSLRSEFAGGVAVAEALGDEGDEGDDLLQESPLFRDSPDLTIGHPLKAPAEKPEMRIRNAENAAGDGRESAHQQSRPSGRRLPRRSNGCISK
jgi:hypothetical protein